MIHATFWHTLTLNLTYWSIENIYDHFKFRSHLEASVMAHLSVWNQFLLLSFLNNQTNPFLRVEASILFSSVFFPPPKSSISISHKKGHLAFTLPAKIFLQPSTLKTLRKRALLQGDPFRNWNFISTAINCVNTCCKNFCNCPACR